MRARLAKYSPRHSVILGGGAAVGAGRSRAKRALAWAALSRVRTMIVTCSRANQRSWLGKEKLKVKRPWGLTLAWA